MLAGIPIRATVAASDLARARVWYEAKLGVTPIAEDVEHLWYEFGGTWLLVYHTAMAGTARSTQAGWTVDDIEAVMSDLRSRGVVFEDYDFGNGIASVNGLLEVGPNRAAWFKDSEGNSFEVSQVG